MVIVTITLILTVVNHYDAAKILGVFPTPSISHHLVFRPLYQELSKRGHEVVVITPDPAFEPDKTPPNLREIDVHDVSYTRWAKLYEMSFNSDDDMETMMGSILIIMNDIVETQFKLPEVQKLIAEEKFDLLLLEACVKPALVYSHAFNAPVIQVSSMGFLDFNVHTVGASWHPILYPNFMNPKIYNLSKWEKIKSLWSYYRIENLLNANEDLENAIAKRLFGSSAPTINELKNNVDMMFLNIHPLWENNRPVPPNVIYIWGIHEKPVKELPKELKNYLDASKNGVIYMSLGTNVKTTFLTPHKVQIMVKVFSQLPYDILWKWDQDELPGRTENIRTSKWLPQADLLQHPNIKAFITQGGIQSTGEAITAGVPLIGIPMLGDQWYNVEHIVKHKIGIRLDMSTLQEDQLKNAIESIIIDKSYQQNIVRLRDVMRDQPMTPLERAVWWTEHLLRHGDASHLRTPAANIPWTQYLELDIVFIILGVILIVPAVIISLVLIIYQYFYRRVISSIKVKNN